MLLTLCRMQYIFLFDFSFLGFFFLGDGHVTQEKLEFKHRLSIALGAAKGDPLQNQ